MKAKTSNFKVLVLLLGFITTFAACDASAQSLGGGLFGRDSGRYASRLIHSWTGSVGTPASTVETVLGSYTLPANTLAVDGQTVRIEATFITAANENAKTARATSK